MTGQTVDDALAMVVGFALESELYDEASATQRVGRRQFQTSDPSGEIAGASRQAAVLAGRGSVRTGHLPGRSALLVRCPHRYAVAEVGTSAADLGVAGIISVNLDDEAN